MTDQPIPAEEKIKTILAKIEKQNKKKKDSDNKIFELYQDIKRTISEYITTEKPFADLEWEYCAYIERSRAHYPKIIISNKDSNCHDYTNSPLSKLFKTLPYDGLELRPTQNTTVYLNRFAIRIEIYIENISKTEQYKWLKTTGIKNLKKQKINYREKEIKETQALLKEEEALVAIFEKEIT